MDPLAGECLITAKLRETCICGKWKPVGTDSKIGSRVDFNIWVKPASVGNTSLIACFNCSEALREVSGVRYGATAKKIMPMISAFGNNNDALVNCFRRSAKHGFGFSSFLTSLISMTASTASVPIEAL